MDIHIEYIYIYTCGSLNKLGVTSPSWSCNTCGSLNKLGVTSPSCSNMHIVA